MERGELSYWGSTVARRGGIKAGNMYNEGKEAGPGQHQGTMLTG